MSNMKQLLESVTRFAGEPEQKPGDQVRGTEKAKTRKDGKHPFAGRLVGGSANESKEEYCDSCDRVESKCVCDDELKESLMQEYKYFVKEQTPTTANAAATASPVANINPAGTGTAQTAAPATPGQAPATPGQAPAPAAPTQATPAQTAKPGQPAPTPATPGQPVKPATGAPGAGTATPPNPQQVKQATDTVTKIMSNPADPFNAQLQALIKKAGMVPR